MAVKLVVRHPQSRRDEQSEVVFEFEQTRVVIGRSAGADVRLPGLGVSEVHATLELSSDKAKLRDEGSTNGTRVNGTALVPTRARTLAAGDEIEIGEFSLTYLSGPALGGPTSPERTASLAQRMLRELAGPDSEAAAPPCLRVVSGPDRGSVINLAEVPSRLVVGRGEQADLVLTDPDVSREHVEIVRDLDGTLVRDLESKNGFEVNGKRLRERRLRHGDTLTLASTKLGYEDPAEQALKQLEGKPDQVLTRTQKLEALQPKAEAESSQAEAKPDAEPSPEKPAEASPSNAVRPASTLGTDLLIYGLAALVLAASLAGLVWLFS